MIQILVFFSPIGTIFNIVILNMEQIAYPVLAVVIAFIVDEITKPILVKSLED